MATKEDKEKVDAILNEPAINHIAKISSIFMLDEEYVERYVKFMNLDKKGITVEEVIDDLIFTWPPTRVYQDY